LRSAGSTGGIGPSFIQQKSVRGSAWVAMLIPPTI
jgi:hypothetical protein